MDPQLLQFLPHRPPMVLLDEVVDIDEKRAISRVKITNESLLAEKGRVPAWVGVEYMAQTVGVYAGKDCHTKGEPPGIGFLLGARKYSSEVDHFENGQVLEVEARPKMIDGGLGQFEAEIRCGSQVLATATLTTIRPTPEQLAQMKQEMK